MAFYITDYVLVNINIKYYSMFNINDVDGKIYLRPVKKAMICSALRLLLSRRSLTEWGVSPCAAREWVIATHWGSSDPNPRTKDSYVCCETELWWSFHSRESAVAPAVRPFVGNTWFV